MNNRQYGGLDPATSALIASLAVGGISAYGAQAMEKNKDTLLDERSGGIIGRLKDIGVRLTAERDAARKELEALKVELQKKQFEINKSKEELGQSAESIQRLKEGTGPALVFKNATTETLKRAVQRTIQKLGEFATGKPGYEWLQDANNLPNTAEALAYPTTYQGKLARMSLPSFYERRLKKAAQIDFDISQKPKGGKNKRRRRRARRGGDAAGTGETEDTGSSSSAASTGESRTAAEQAQTAIERANESLESVPVEQPATTETSSAFSAAPEQPLAATETSPPPAFPFPTYEEFAKLYTDAINEVSLTGVQEIRKKSEEYRANVLKDKENKRNETAKKAANALADKLSKVVATGRTETDKPVPTEMSADLTAKRTELIAMLAEADTLMNETLRNINTEAEWNENKERPNALLTDIPKKTKEYIQAVKKEPKTPVATTTTETTEAGPAVEKPSDSIHQDILKTTPLSIKDLKARIKQFQKAWDNAKSARESFCKVTKDIGTYKGGPEAYERITEVMGKADEELFSMKKLLRLLTTFLDDYKNETQGIAFVRNESFEQERHIGGVFQGLIDLRSKFTKYQEDLAKSKVTTASIEEKLKKAIEKLKTIGEKGPMTPAERVEEEKIRKQGEEFRLTPLITDCYPYGSPPSAETGDLPTLTIKPPPTTPPASTSIKPEVLESLSTYKDLGTGTGLPPAEEEEDTSKMTIREPEPTTPAQQVTNKAIGFQKVPGKLRQSPATKLFRKLTRRKKPLSTVGQGRSRKRTLKKRRGGK